MDETKSPTNQGNKPGAQGSGSDTVSAAKISAGTSVGTVGQPAKPQEHASQSSTLASHTSKPLGGGAGSAGTGTSTGSSGANQGNHPQSRGPEHLRHQDKDAGQGLGQQARAGAGQAADTAKRTAQSAAETAKDATSQVQERAGELYEEATERAGELYEQASEWARDAYEQGTRYFSRAGRPMQGLSTGSVGRFARENPVLVGVVGLAAGLLLGALLPRTRREDETLGRWSDELREQGMRYARDMTHRGREFVEDAFADGDPRFASHESEWRQDDQDRRRSGPSGRFQNH
jgi:ElaB/YqjD/DUF883 family membrane-anchored ribosome-binding protein